MPVSTRKQAHSRTLRAALVAGVLACAPVARGEPAGSADPVDPALQSEVPRAPAAAGPPASPVPAPPRPAASGPPLAPPDVPAPAPDPAVPLPAPAPLPPAPDEAPTSPPEAATPQAPQADVGADPVPAVSPASGARPPEAHGPPAPDTGDADAPAMPLAILGTRVLPGSQARLAWSGAESFAGIATPTPVLVAHGARRGPVLCLTAAVHGDELNGIEVVRRVYYDLRPSEMRGTVIGVPIVNLPGFQRGSRYLPDRRDLNRYFPGYARGTAAGRIAHSFFNQVVLRCSALVDLHTGSLHRTNLPHVRANMADAGSRALAESFGGLPLLHDPPIGGTLRDAAAAQGIAAVTIEAGSPLQLESSEVRAGVRAVQSLLITLGMTGSRARPAPVGPVYESAFWVRAESGGILLTAVQPGARVRAGQRLGTVADPITNARVPIVSPVDGTVLGMALDQVVMPGFATHHLGIEQSSGPLPEPNGPPPEPAAGGPSTGAPVAPGPPAPQAADPGPGPGHEGRPE